jgi:hypothetical protein
LLKKSKIIKLSFHEQSEELFKAFEFWMLDLTRMGIFAGDKHTLGFYHRQRQTRPRNCILWNNVQVLWENSKDK